MELTEAQKKAKRLREQAYANRPPEEKDKGKNNHKSLYIKCVVIAIVMVTFTVLFFRNDKTNVNNLNIDVVKTENGSTEVNVNNLDINAIKTDADILEKYKVAAEKGNAIAQRVMGQLYYEGFLGSERNKHKEAFKWFKLAAEQGDAEAQVQLGYMYRYSMGGASKDYSQVLKWYTLAAEQGNDRAQFYLGKMYLEGDGIESNSEEALKWYKQSGEQGNIRAQSELGDIYSYGKKGIPIDPYEAFEWHKLAADQGREESAFRIGWGYLNGVGISKNIDEAIKYFQMACDKGFKAACSHIEELE